ncbi:MAG: hypothetical protein ACRDJB_05320 [Actinomycetota bacterium]
MKLIILVVYLVVGVLVASAQDYLGEVSNIGGALNLILAVVLWPLLLVGVDFNIKIGDDDGGGNRNGVLLLLGPSLTYARGAGRIRLDRITKPDALGRNRNRVDEDRIYPGPLNTVVC